MKRPVFDVRAGAGLPSVVGYPWVIGRPSRVAEDDREDGRGPALPGGCIGRLAAAWGPGPRFRRRGPAMPTRYGHRSAGRRLPLDPAGARSARMAPISGPPRKRGGHAFIIGKNIESAQIDRTRNRTDPPKNQGAARDFGANFAT